MRPLAAVCGLFLFAIALHGGQVNPPRTSKSKGTAAPKAQKTAPPRKTPSAEKAIPQRGAVVFVDPQTGQIREATPEEIGTLNAPASAAQGVPSPPTVVQTSGGGVGLVLGPEFEVFMVATKTPDGKLLIEEVIGEKAAQKHVDPDQTPKSGNEK